MTDFYCLRLKLTLLQIQDVQIIFSEIEMYRHKEK